MILINKIKIYVNILPYYYEKSKTLTNSAQIVLSFKATKTGLFSKKSVYIQLLLSE